MDNRYNLPDTSLKTTIARSGFYILSIGGLMAFFAVILWFSWNNFLNKYEEEKKMSYLESIGLVSIAYVIYSGIRFGQIREAEKQCQAAHSQQVKQEIQQHHNNNTSSLYNLSTEEREQLKRELARCCNKNISADSNSTTKEEKVTV
ncbi:MAG: hypothetical protein U0Y96_06390 [Candidatus Kapaibacterium sp.]